MTHRRSRKHHRPAVPASPAPGVSAEQPQTHPTWAWSPDCDREAASNVQRGAAICSSGWRHGQCGCGLRISSLPRASRGTTGPAASRPGPPLFPRTLGGRRVHTVTYFLGGSCRQSVIEPLDGAGSFHSPRSSPTFLSKKCEGMLNTLLPPRHGPSRMRWGRGGCYTHRTSFPSLHSLLASLSPLPVTADPPLWPHFLALLCSSLLEARWHCPPQAPSSGEALWRLKAAAQPTGRAHPAPAPREA